MPKAKRGHSDEHRDSGRSSHESESEDDRVVSGEEWEELLDDAASFKKEHDKTFRILSGRDE